MSGETNIGAPRRWERDDDLQRALERLTIQEIWRRAGLPNAPREGNVVVKSPFREDRHGKAFSIFKRGLVAKDQGTGEVFSVYKFAERALGIAGKELVDRLCEWAGVTRTVQVRQKLHEAQTAAAEGRVVELPKEVQALARKIEKRKQNWENENALWAQVEAARGPKRPVYGRDEKSGEWFPNAQRVDAEWSAVVRARFAEGWRAMQRDEERMQEWARERAWPVEWVRWLHEEGLIARPRLPWIEEGEVPSGSRASHGMAFRVDVPICGRDGAVSELRHVGYHQRYVVLEDGEGKRVAVKNWTYVPYMPAPEKQRTEFQRAMVAAELERDGEIGVSRVAAVPFVMGDFSATRFLVVSEGQWDAVTFAGACGWLAGDTTWPAGACVMGVRGNEGAETFLSYWQPWLALHRPEVLVLADNDAAGRKWDHAEPKQPGQPRPVTVVEKLAIAGARRVHVSRVRAEVGKDFNDYWRARKPTPEQMAAWLAGMGFLKN